MEEKEKNEMLVVSFGTTRASSRENAIGGVERALEKAFPDWQVVRAFTSGTVIRRVAEKEGTKIDNPEAALKKAVETGVRKIVVVPTHVLDGEEYQKLERLYLQFAHMFDFSAFGKPLLDTEDDLIRILYIMRKLTRELDDGHTEIVFVGHGSEEKATRVYSELGRLFAEVGLDHYAVGTIEASPSFEDVKKEAEKNGASRIVLLPLMLVAGEHVMTDIKGDQPSSWWSRLEADGYEVLVGEKGLGQLEDVQKMYVEHVGRFLK